MSEQPYKKLGEHVRKLREKAKETVAELSGALELEVSEWEKVETGTLRPSEDQIILLQNHFNLVGRAADRLWDLAGYDEEGEAEMAPGERANLNNPMSAVVTLQDSRILYTDMVHVSANNYGVTINFMQGMGPNNQSIVVSRLGMSVTHAKSLIKVLTKTLDQVEAKKSARKSPKLLPPAQE